MTPAEIILSIIVGVLFIMSIRKSRRINALDRKIGRMRETLHKDNENFVKEVKKVAVQMERDNEKHLTNLVKNNETLRDHFDEATTEFRSAAERSFNDYASSAYEIMGTFEDMHQRLNKIEGAWKIFYPLYLKARKMIQDGVGQKKIGNQLGIGRHRVQQIAAQMREEAKAEETQEEEAK